MRPRLDVTRGNVFTFPTTIFAAKIQQKMATIFTSVSFIRYGTKEKKKKKETIDECFWIYASSLLIDVGWCIFFFFHVDHFFRENV